MSVYSRKRPPSWVWNSRPFIIWFLPISESLDPIAYQPLLNLCVFSAIQNCSHASKLCRCRFFCLEWSCQLVATSPQSPRWMSNPWTIYHVFWLKLPEFHRHLLGLSWGPAHPVSFFYINCCYTDHVSSPMSALVWRMWGTGLSLPRIVANNSQRPMPDWVCAVAIVTTGVGAAHTRIGPLGLCLPLNLKGVLAPLHLPPPFTSLLLCRSFDLRKCDFTTKLKDFMR